MYISDLSIRYFSGFHELYHWKTNSKQENLIATVKVISYAILIPPFVVGVVWGAANLYGRVKLWASSQKVEGKPQTSIPSDPLSQSHAKLHKQANRLKLKMVNHDVWKDPSFISEVDAFMEEANKETTLFIETLEKISGGDLEKKATLLARHNPEGTNPNFCKFFFYSSVAEMYHFARGCYGLENGTMQPKVLAKDNADAIPYFTEGTPQHKWRKYNFEFLKNFNDFKDLLFKKEKRFEHWFFEDLKEDPIHRRCMSPSFH